MHNLIVLAAGAEFHPKLIDFRPWATGVAMYENGDKFTWRAELVTAIGNNWEVVVEINGRCSHPLR